MIDLPEILPGVDPPPIRLPSGLGDLLDPKDRRDDEEALNGLLDYLLGGGG